MVEIEMSITRSMDELTTLKSSHLCHHLKQKGIARNVERHSEKCVSRTLIELKRELAVSHIELEHGMARRQSHIIGLPWMPGTYKHSATIRISLYLIEYILNLIHNNAISILVKSLKGTPLLAIHRSELTILISPLIPDTHTMLLKILHVGIALQEPQKLIDDRLEMQFLCSEQRKTISKIKAHLISKHALCSRTSTVSLHSTLFQDSVKQIKILLHYKSASSSSSSGSMIAIGR